MKPKPHLVVGDSFADGAGASAAGDFNLAPAEQVFSVPRHADGPAALLAPVPKWPNFSYPRPAVDPAPTHRVALGRLVERGSDGHASRQR